jgi:hypothetical protein
MDSTKSQKTVASMLIQPAAAKGKDKQKEEVKSKNNVEKKSQIEKENIQPTKDQEMSKNGADKASTTETDEMLKKREEFIKKQTMPKSSPKAPTKIPAADKNKKKGKAPTNWLGPGIDPNGKIDYCDTTPADAALKNGNGSEEQKFVTRQQALVGTLLGNVGDMETDESEEDVETVDDDDKKKADAPKQKTGGFSVFSAFKSLVGSKKIDRRRRPTGFG